MARRRGYIVMQKVNPLSSSAAAVEQYILPNWSSLSPVLPVGEGTRQVPFWFRKIVFDLATEDYLITAQYVPTNIERQRFILDIKKYYINVISFETISRWFAIQRMLDKENGLLTLAEQYLGDRHDGYAALVELMTVLHGDDGMETYSMDVSNAMRLVAKMLPPEIAWQSCRETLLVSEMKASSIKIGAFLDRSGRQEVGPEADLGVDKRGLYRTMRTELVLATEYACLNEDQRRFTKAVAAQTGSYSR